MTNYELYKSGALDEAIERNLIKEKVEIYCEVYEAFTLARNKGNSYEAAIFDTSDFMNVSIRTVKRSIEFARSAK